MAKMTLMISPAVAVGLWAQVSQPGRGRMIRRSGKRTFVAVNERGAEAESEAVASVDDEEEDREACAVPDRSLEVDVAALVDMAVVKAGVDVLGAEGLGGADGGDDLLCEGAALCDVLKGELHVL